MYAVDIQYVTIFVKRLHRKEIKDKHNITIEMWGENSVVAYPHPLHVQFKCLY